MLTPFAIVVAILGNYVIETNEPANLNAPVLRIAEMPVALGALPVDGTANSIPETRSCTQLRRVS